MMAVAAPACGAILCFAAHSRWAGPTSRLPGTSSRSCLWRNLRSSAAPFIKPCSALCGPCSRPFILQQNTLNAAILSAIGRWQPNYEVCFCGKSTVAAEAVTKTPGDGFQTRGHFDVSEEKQSSKDEEPQER